MNKFFSLKVTRQGLADAFLVASAVLAIVSILTEDES